MSKMLSKFSGAFFLVLTLHFPLLHSAKKNSDPWYADPCSTPYDSCYKCCDNFKCGADFIYWNPCIDNLNYAVLYNNDVNSDPLTGSNVGHYKYISPDWEPGFRVYLGKKGVWRGFDLEASYNWIQVKKNSSVSSSTPGSLQSTLMNPAVVPPENYGSISAKYKLLYQTFDILLATDYNFSAVHIFKPFFGFTGLFLDQKINSEGTRNVFGVNETNTLAWNCDYWGLGLKVGSEYRYSFCGGMEFFASISGSLTAGKTEMNRKDLGDDGAEENAVGYASERQAPFLNGWNIQSGFLYEGRWSGWEYQHRLGYEFSEWQNVSTIRRYTNTTSSQQLATSSSPTTTTLGFHGIFAGLRLGF